MLKDEYLRESMAMSIFFLVMYSCGETPNSFLNNLKKCYEKVAAVTGGKIQLNVELNYNYEFIDSKEGADEDGL